MVSVLAMAAEPRFNDYFAGAAGTRTVFLAVRELSGNKAPALWRQVLGWSTGAGRRVILLVAALVMWFGVPQPVDGLRPVAWLISARRV